MIRIISSFLKPFSLMIFFKDLLLSQTSVVKRFQNKGCISFLMIILDINIKWQLYFPNKHHSMNLVFGFKSLVTNGHVRLRIFNRSFQIYSFFRLQICNYVEDFYANFLNLTGSILKINIIMGRF